MPKVLHAAAKLNNGAASRGQTQPSVKPAGKATSKPAAKPANKPVSKPTPKASKTVPKHAKKPAPKARKPAAKPAPAAKTKTQAAKIKKPARKPTRRAARKLKTKKKKAAASPPLPLPPPPPPPAFVSVFSALVTRTDDGRSVFRVPPPAAPRLPVRGPVSATVRALPVEAYTPWASVLRTRAAMLAGRTAAKQAALRRCGSHAGKAVLEAQKRERLRLLRAGDDAAYKELLSDERDERYGQLVQQTEAILRGLGIDAAADEGSGPPPGQPAAMCGVTLKPYQLEGVAWLHRNVVRGLNSVLADEMGLGKTAQTIALFLRILEERKGGVQHRFLVVAPLSTLDNWMSELARMAPSLKAMKFHGPREERRTMAAAIVKHDVVVTQYASFMNAHLADMQKALGAVKWHVAVVDEGHKLNNVNSLFSKNLRRLRMSNRVLLTGTPLQNDVHELWSLLNFLMPSLFKNPSSFDEWFPSAATAKAGKKKAADAEPATEEEKLLLARRLHALLRPFLLRRQKSDVLSQLPTKTIVVVKAPLSEFQLSLYRQAADHRVIGPFCSVDRKEQPDGAAEADPKAEEEVAIDWEHENLTHRSNRLDMGVYVALRKVCLHPYLVFNHNIPNPHWNRHLIAGSGKMEILDRMLTKLCAAGHKVLIFTQFAQVLDVLEDVFQHAYGWEAERQYERLDGSVASDDRKAAMERFQHPDSKASVFILTTRAGGQGINLQAADTVIFYDMDWNPQQDLQAIARAHRLGQTRAVMVFRLVTEAPVEKHMVKVAGEKVDREALAIQAGMYDQRSTALERDVRIKEVLAAPVSFEALQAAEDADLSRAVARDSRELAFYCAEAKREPRPLSGVGDLPKEYAGLQAAVMKQRAQALLSPFEQGQLPLPPRSTTLQKKSYAKYGCGSQASSSGSDSESESESDSDDSDTDSSSCSGTSASSADTTQKDVPGASAPEAPISHTCSGDEPSPVERSSE